MGQQFLKANKLLPAVYAARKEFRADLERRVVTELPRERKESLAIVTLLDPRFKDIVFDGIPGYDHTWAVQILKAANEDACALKPNLSKRLHRCNSLPPQYTKKEAK